jgi:glycosyltransferase involved in cell wall biosynthesis
MALGLQQAAMLAGYWAGVPCLAAQRHGIPAGLWTRLVRYSTVPLRPELVQGAPWVPGLRRVADSVLPARPSAWVDFLACRLFDRWVAARLHLVECTAVVGCEISARSTFRQARRLGRTTILDAASIHHGAQDRLHGFREPAALHRRIVAIKDEEIRQADHVFTVSNLARRTYLQAGVPPGRVHALSLGADIELFAPGADERSGPIRLVFAGATLHRKAFDLVVAAFGRVLAQVPSATLALIGPDGDEADRAAQLAPGSVRRLGQLSQRELSRELASADCLVLPSRQDSYGMVVVEALACGTPVLVSDQVGAADLVRTGHNGWVVPAGDLDALTEQMLWCARSPAALRGMREACRASAVAATWPDYHRRLAALMASLTGQPAA